MSIAATTSDERAIEQPGRLYRLFWRWHLLAALLVVPFVLWQSVTGSLYLWSYAWIDWRYPALTTVDVATPAPIETRLRAALADRRAAPVAEIRVPESTQRTTVVLLAEPNGLVAPVFVDAGATVRGTLGASAWLPGVTRALHGGWPAGAPGSWLLELGDCWAMVMIVTGLYLWWPRGTSWSRALWPRSGRGARIFWRDLHACVAAWFSLVILAFLVTALPWTQFWGGHVIGPIQARLAQDNPIGFAPGGASAGDVVAAAPALDRAIAEARLRGVVGTLQVHLGTSPLDGWWLHNVDSPPGLDRYMVADRRTGAIVTDVHGRENPAMARLIDAGVHLHQGDYGAINRWTNTAVAFALLWMTATGLLSWWKRRPRGTWGVPAKSQIPLPKPLLGAAALACVVLPLLGASVAALWLFDAIGRAITSRA